MLFKTYSSALDRYEYLELPTRFSFKKLDEKDLEKKYILEHSIILDMNCMDKTEVLDTEHLEDREYFVFFKKGTKNLSFIDKNNTIRSCYFMNNAWIIEENGKTIERL